MENLITDTTYLNILDNTKGNIDNICTTTLSIISKKTSILDETRNRNYFTLNSTTTHFVQVKTYNQILFSPNQFDVTVDNIFVFEFH